MRYINENHQKKQETGDRVDENSLTRAFASGGDEELREAIELYGHRLLRFCHGILCNYHEAQDAVQLTFIKAYRKRNSFKQSLSLQAWLYRIAYHTCLDMMRRNKWELFGLFYNKSDIENDTSYISAELKEALLSLSPKDRALLFSRAVDDKDYAELADVFHASAAALRKRYERARKKLAGFLRQADEDFPRQEESI